MCISVHFLRAVSISTTATNISPGGGNYPSRGRDLPEFSHQLSTNPTSGIGYKWGLELPPPFPGSFATVLKRECVSALMTAEKIYRPSSRSEPIAIYTSTKFNSLYYLYFCISVYTCANVLLTYLLT